MQLCTDSYNSPFPGTRLASDSTQVCALRIVQLLIARATNAQYSAMKNIDLIPLVVERRRAAKLLSLTRARIYGRGKIKKRTQINGVRFSLIPTGG